MTLGLIGKKIGMTRRFYENGQSVPVTVLHVEPGKVVDVITKEKRGYSAVLVGFGHIKNSKVTKQMKGVFAKKSLEPKKILKEFRVDTDSDLKLGSDIDLNIFKDINFVDIRSKTIGKGFAGVMKRHNFAGLRATHGVSVSHRSHGSTGQRQDPGRVFKGKKMAGHMGDKFRTVERLEIIETDLENNLLLNQLKSKFLSKSSTSFGITIGLTSFIAPRLSIQFSNTSENSSFVCAFSIFGKVSRSCLSQFNSPPAAFG